MSDRLTSTFDDVYEDALSSVPRDLTDEEASSAIKNLRILSECRPPVTPEPEAVPAPPTTVLGKLKAGVAGVWESETTRVLIKAGGAFAGVALVVWTTVHRDHVIQKEAMTQANRSDR